MAETAPFQNRIPSLSKQAKVMKIFMETTGSVLPQMKFIM
jgi:hypothetical protein